MASSQKREEEEEEEEEEQENHGQSVERSHVRTHTWVQHGAQDMIGLPLPPPLQKENLLHRFSVPSWERVDFLNLFF